MPGATEGGRGRDAAGEARSRTEEEVRRQLTREQESGTRLTAEGAGSDKAVAAEFEQEVLGREAGRAEAELEAVAGANARYAVLKKHDCSAETMTASCSCCRRRRC